jgi:hypothetical protein
MATQFNYLLTIPMPVARAEMPGDAKLLYGLISSSTNEDRVCEATNLEFASIFKVSERNVIRWLRALEEAKFIHVTNEGRKRKIKPFFDHDKNVMVALNHDKNVNDKNVIHDKNVIPATMTKMSYHDKNVTVNTIDNQRFTNQGIKNDMRETLQTTATKEKTNNIISRSSLEKKSKSQNSAPPQFLFAETKYVTESDGIEIFEAEILAKSKDYEIADLKYYYNRGLTWSNNKGARKHDWITAIITWIQLDQKSGKLVLKQNKQNFKDDTGISINGAKLSVAAKAAIERGLAEIAAREQCG